MLFIVVAYSICIIDRINKDPNTLAKLKNLAAERGKSSFHFEATDTNANSTAKERTAPRHLHWLNYGD